jgi:hypothetical protein
VSFGMHARRVRNRALPYEDRVRSLHSCMKLCRPPRYVVTVQYLEGAVGRFDLREEALLRALDLLVDGRRRRSAAQLEYAARRREEKRAGRRTPRAGDPAPSTVGHWFGPYPVS